MAILHLYENGEVLRKATAEELRISLSRAKVDGGVGVFQVEGASCYVVEEPADANLLLLLELEWAGNSDNTECICCRALQWNGHADHCRLDRVLKGTFCETCNGTKAVVTGYSPATYITSDMASDAGDEALAGSVYQEEQFEFDKCPDCNKC